MPALITYSTTGSSLSSDEIAFAQRVAASFSLDMGAGWIKTIRQVDPNTSAVVEYHADKNIAYVTPGGFRTLTYRPVYGDGKYYMAATGVKYTREPSTVELKLSSVSGTDFYRTPPIWLGRPNDFKKAYLAAYPVYSYSDSGTRISLSATRIYNTAGKKKVLLPSTIRSVRQQVPFVLNGKPTILWYANTDAGYTYGLWDIESGSIYQLTGVAGQYTSIAVSDSVVWLLIANGSSTKITGCRFDTVTSTFSQVDTEWSSALNTYDFLFAAGPSACCFARTKGSVTGGIDVEITHIGDDFTVTAKTVSQAEIDAVSGATALEGTNKRISIANYGGDMHVTGTDFSLSIYGDDGNIYIGGYSSRVGATKSGLVKLVGFSQYANPYFTSSGKNVSCWNSGGVWYVADHNFSVTTSIACRFIFVSASALYAIGTLVGFVGSGIAAFYAGAWVQIASDCSANYVSGVWITPDVDFIVYYTTSGGAKMLAVASGSVVLVEDLVVDLIYSKYTYYAEKRMLLIGDIAVVVDVGLPTMQLIQGARVTVSPAIGVSNTTYMDATHCPVTQDWVDDWVVQTRALQPAPPP